MLRLFPSGLCCLWIFAASLSVAQDSPVIPTSDAVEKDADDASVTEAGSLPRFTGSPATNQPIVSKRLTDQRISFVAHHSSGEAVWIVTDKTEVHVVDPLTLEPLAEPKQLFHATISGAGLMPDQSGLLLCGYGGRVLPVGTAKWKSADWEVGDGIRPLPDVGFQSIAVAPTGNALALGTRSGSVALMDMQTGMLRWTVSVGEIPINRVAWSRDAKQLAACSGNWQRPHEPGLVYLLDPETGDVIKKLADHRGQVNQVAFSPDANSLTSVSTDQCLLTYDLQDLEKPPAVLKRSSGVTALLPLGEGLCAVALFGGGVEVCDLQQGRMKVRFAGHKPPAGQEGKPSPPLIRAMSVAPDGSHLVTTDFNGMTYVWSLSNAVPSPSQYDQTHWNAKASADILKIGTFAQADEQGRPVGWQDLSAFETGHARMRTDGSGTVTLSSIDNSAKTSIATSVDLPPETAYVTFKVRLRGPSIQRGETPNAGGGVSFSFIDSAGSDREMPRVDPPYEGYRDWYNSTHTARVLPGETKLRVSITMTDATGALDIDHILIIPSSADNEATDAQINELRLALENDDPEAIAQLLDGDPRMLEMRTGPSDNGTPLIRAAWKGSPKVAAKLIELGADIEAKDENWGNTPLQWCGWWGTHQVTAVLIEAGAEPRGASQLAQRAKNANGFAKRGPEDFDKVSKLVDEYEAKLAEE